MLAVRINGGMVAIRNGLVIRDRPGEEGGPDRSQRHRAYFSDRVEFRTLARVLPQAAAVSRHEAGDRQRHKLLLRRRAHRVGINAPASEHAGAAFEQNRVGLHHLCFRARPRADVYELELEPAPALPNHVPEFSALTQPSSNSYITPLR